MIDTHLHLTFPDYEPDSHSGGIAAVLDRAASAGVTGMISVATTSQDARRALDIAIAHDRVWCSAGVHPLYADQGPHDWAALLSVARHPKCVAWGELGLDQHYDDPPQPTQRRVLEEQLAFITEHNAEVDLPLIIHCRKAFDDLIPVLGSSGLDPARMVFHCFTGDADDATKVLDFGAWISFTGVVTYRNAPGVRDAAALVPADRIMVETDAPFLSPEPHRGVRPNEPAMTRVIAEFLAAHRRVDFDTFHAQLNDNTSRFFRIDAR
jgi:TatD DNase family protein